MAVQPSYLEYVLEQLAGLPALRPNRMFGGIGLYSDGIFFGLIDDDTLFFKTGESNVASYRERNMPRFMPFPDRPDAALGYHQVPADVIEDADALREWARRSVAVALAVQAAKAKSARRPRSKATSPRKRAESKTAPKRNAPKRKAARKMPAKPLRKPVTRTAAKRRPSARHTPRR
jgi:DNA transformation protein and related proteins